LGKPRLQLVQRAVRERGISGSFRFSAAPLRLAKPGVSL
jgi:hypothetical protein